jgi:UDPglucose 6-dehydrogenase
VTCLDIDESKIASLSLGKVPIVEEGLEELVHAGLANGTLSFTTSLTDAVTRADVVILCVPTPQDDDGSADLQFVEQVSRDIASVLKEGAVVVNKSTVPVGTASRVAEIIGRSGIAVVSNPEFLRQGTAVHDFLHPARVVIGGDDAVAIEMVADLYVGVDAPVLKMKTASAEA